MGGDYALASRVLWKRVNEEKRGRGETSFREIMGQQKTKIQTGTV
jgi:hypothetical protein